jgi:hypothetical protein
MKEFNGHRVHFDISRDGLMHAHTSRVTWEEFEEYKRFFGCGKTSTNPITGDINWQADPLGKNENSRRIALRFLEEYGDEFPAKAAQVRAMLGITDEDY